GRTETPVAAPAPVPAPVAEARPAPVTPVASPVAARSSLFEERPAPAQATITPASEPRVISRIVDPMVEDDEPAISVAPAPRPVVTPQVQRPNPYAHTAPPRPSQPAPAPRLSTEEEGRESFWRGLFPQRQATPAAAPVAQSAPVQDEADRYVPGQANGQAKSNLNPATRSEVQPSMDTEDDLEIPSFLRRLAN
ncbi:MAG TPA: cell division protein FtsZ, partial [Asticcacaulis sp.]|nr:cell division protein FtsZ [Asticcacaulis sp.]